MSDLSKQMLPLFTLYTEHFALRDAKNLSILKTSTRRPLSDETVSLARTLVSHCNCLIEFSASGGETETGGAEFCSISFFNCSISALACSNRACQRLLGVKAESAPH